MKDTIYLQLLDAYEQLSYIVDLLTPKGFILHDYGVLELKKIDTPEKLKHILIGEIESFLNKIDSLSFFFVDEQLGGLRMLSYKRIKKIKIITQNQIKNERYTPEHKNTYKQYRAVQREIQRRFLELLVEEMMVNLKSAKYHWCGSQRQLIELFDMLFKNGWVKSDETSEEKKCLPIVDMFNIEKKGIIQPLNIQSFKKAWQPDQKIRNPENYEPVFDKIPINARNSN